MRATSQSKRGQRGISFIGLLFVAGVLACVGVVAAQVIPTLIEYQAIDKAANKAKEGIDGARSARHLRRAQAIDDFKSVSGKDLDVQKVGDKVVVSFAYDAKSTCSARPSCCSRYKGQSR